MLLASLRMVGNNLRAMERATAECSALLLSTPSSLSGCTVRENSTKMDNASVSFNPNVSPNTTSSHVTQGIYSILLAPCDENMVLRKK